MGEDLAKAEGCSECVKLSIDEVAQLGVSV